jgi:DNA polymerase III alpha subunit
MESFSGYSFSKAHSASFAVESFQSLYLRAHYPLEFMTAVLNNFGGFYKTQDYVHEARMMGAKIEAPCINRSVYMNGILEDTIILGFVLLHQLEQRSAEAIIRERNNGGEFRSLDEFVHRVALSKEQLLILIRIGAFRFTGKPKKVLLWEAHMLLQNQNERHSEKNVLFTVEEPEFRFPELSESFIENAYDEIELLGFPLCSPFELIERPQGNFVLVSDLPEFMSKDIELLGSVVAVKETRTVKGDRMNFATFMDSSGHLFDTVHFPPIVAAYPFRGRGVYRIRGKVCEEFSFFSIEVHWIEKIPYISRGY